MRYSRQRQIAIQQQIGSFTK